MNTKWASSVTATLSVVIMMSDTLRVYFVCHTTSQLTKNVSDADILKYFCFSFAKNTTTTTTLEKRELCEKLCRNYSRAHFTYNKHKYITKSHDSSKFWCEQSFTPHACMLPFETAGVAYNTNLHECAFHQAYSHILSMTKCFFIIFFFFLKCQKSKNPNQRSPSNSK